MGAKKPSTPIKQNNINSNNNLSGVVKNAQIKKITTKDAKSNLIASKDNDVKKQSVATSNGKKTSKLVANNAKTIKKSQNVVDSKKNKKQPMGSNSNKVNNSKSNHTAVTETEEVKSNFNLNHDESNKTEKLSSTTSSLSSMSSQSDNAKRKISEKESDKSKSTVASIVGGKKLNNKNDESNGKKMNADKQKSTSKVVRKNSKERDNKIKISNELKNLGIEMSKSSNSSFDGIQEDISSGMKTSICEMVKLKKARHNQNSNNAVKTKGSTASQSTVDNNVAAADNKSPSKISKESPQGEKIVILVNKIEPKSKASDNFLTQVQSEQQILPKDDEKSQKSTKKVINNTQTTKSIESITTVKRKYMKKNKEAIEPQKDATTLIASITTENENKPKEKKSIVKKSNENVKLSSPKKLKSDVQSTGKVNTTTNTSNSKEALEKRKYSKKQTDGSINNQSKVESVNKGAEVITECLNTNVIENIKKESTDAKQKETANNISNKGKEKSTLAVKNNDFKKASPKKVANETKTQANNGKSGSVKDAKKTAATKKDKSATSKRNNNAEEKDPLKLSSSESESASADSDSDMEISDDIFKKPAKPQQSLRNKNMKQIRVIKKSRVASLNAIAKVHCLYENEARTHLDSSISKAIKKPVNIVVCNVSSDEEDDDDEESSDDKETENVSKRSLRTAPGLRAIGKHWEMDSLSSDIDSDSDISQRPAKNDAKTKSIAKSNSTKNQDTKPLAKQHDAKSSSKLKNQIKKTLKQSSKQIKASDDSQRDSDKEADRKLSSSSAVRKKQQQKNSVVSKKSLASAVSKKKSNGSIKRKKTKDDDKNCDKNVITKKRMASLNASAILAANYEIENYAAKHESSTTETSDSSENDDDEEKDKKSKTEPPTMKKEKKDVKMESAEEPRPKSTTNLVKIDTDVTITGVYVNSALVSSQETICKTLKYRTAYSVTEECVVSRPPTQEPPKSYTPLSALTNMRPPMGQQLQDPCMTSSSEQYQPQMPHQPQPQMYDQHMGPVPPSYQYPPSHTHPMSSTSSSAFYPPQPVHHRDPMGYYQPAGPLISPHLLPPPPTSLESDQTQSNQPTSGATGENDPDVMITGGDIAPRPQQQQPYRYGPHPPPPDFSRPLHPQQMHYPPTYPPYYYGQPPPPTDLCYPYYPPKYYPNSPYASRRPYMAPSYYQPPPLDYRSPPQPVPQNAPQQIVPAAPTPQHIDPHYSSAPYYPSAYNTGQCYSQTPPRNLQPPAYLDAHQYHSASCPCPMQSCQSKNVHTGTGPTNKAKGPVSASSNGMAESSSATVLSCKIENNILSPSVLIKPENDKMNGTSSTSIENQNQIGMGSGVLKVHELYPNIPTNVKVLDTPQLSLSPARGSTGIQQIPTVQHEAAVQPTENNLNSDNVSLSLRKQARIGKSMERDRQQQNHTNHGYHNHLLHHHNNNNHSTMIECGSRALEMTTQFKQEFLVKKERESDVKVEKNCDDDMDIEMDFRSSSIKVEQPELPIETTQKLPENDVTTVNLTTESGDECGIDYTIKKRKHDDSDADVIVLSDNNSTQDTPIVTPPVKRRKLLETPINTPKKSSPNSYKNLIKPNAFATSTSEATTVASTPTVAVTKPKLLASNANKSKQSIKRKSLLKSKSNSFKTIGFAIKAKRRALLKRKKQQQQQRKALEVEEKSQSQNITNTIEKLSSDNDQLIENATEQSVLIEDENDNSSETCEQASTEISEHNEEKSMDGSSEYSGKSNIDLTIDRVAKGYFSESDVFSSLSKHRKTKSQKRFEAKLLDLCAKKKKKMLNGKDKDLTVSSEKEKSKKKTKNSKVNKEKETKEGTSVTAAVTSTLDREMSKNKKVKEKTSNASKKTKKTKTKEPKENLELIKEKKKTKTTSGKKKKNFKEIENEKDILQPDELLPSTHSTPKRKQNNNKKVSTNTAAATPIITTPVVNEKKIETSTIDSDEDDKTIVPKDEDTSTSLLSTATTTTTTTVKTTKPHLDETDVANNNNECFEDNNNRQKQQEPLTLYKTAAYGWTTAINKASGKKGRKGRKLKLTLPNDIVIPKSTSIPRWSNGWVFEGEPYQALVFLNSDDPPVPRTCYDSMRHEECGDVIRPRDCVLLRAGGKRNELPYVAKVAQLFENPEDGEMMMSLFWYYRPEHTEQGRQCNDAIDEVFASRHKDHNSVACIEDKCYVITYNEYCRYRKSLKAVEENIEEPPSVVPKLQLSERRLVPPNTSPELVMFCRRVYDFRAKRLMDDKKKK